MDVQTLEVLNTPGMNDDRASAFQTREKPTHTRTRSRSQIPVPKTRRATGESIHRPLKGGGGGGGGGQSKVPTISTTAKAPSTPKANSVSAPSTPRPIPKNKNKNALQPSSSSAYIFDDAIENPFVSSTPPAFTPSMERTGLVKPAPMDENVSSSKRQATERRKESASPQLAKKEPVKESEISVPVSVRNVVTPTTPEPSTEKPAISSMTRSRNASFSSGFHRPRYEDMILPAVARRIKEQGLYDHDVVAYSDDYDAPLYKVPSSAATQGPFASYDRAKAASSASLILQQQQHFDMDTEELPPNPLVPDMYNAPSLPSKKKQDDTDQIVPEVVEQEKPSPVQPRLSEDNTKPESPPAVTRPERPRRARRNTDHPSQPASPVLEEYRPRRAHRPVPDEPSSNGSRPSSGQRRDRYESNQSWDMYVQQQRRSQDQQMYKSNSRDGYHSNEIRTQDLSHISANNNNNYERNEYSSPVQHQQQQQQQQQQQDHRSYRTDSRNHYHQNESGNQDVSRGYNSNYNSSPVASHRQYNARQEEQLQNHYQNDDYNRSRRQDAYDSQRTRYSPQHDNPYGDYGNTQQNDFNSQKDAYPAKQGGGYDAQPNDYHTKQGGYGDQQQNFNKSYGQQDYSTQPIPPQRSPHRPEMVQVEMSDMSTGPKGSDANQAGSGPQANTNKKEKKMCCIIM
ncbi:MAG: hypothetical protein J3Q66DRAFT_355506 [Benniella sp.]|nr:MAG: hypothetical protein J3Q66DRAFT_355506 [Benniella sp.]